MAKMSKEERQSQRFKFAWDTYARVQKQKTFPLPRIITIGVQKGGVAKTSLCANLGVGLAERGKDVLLIDLDPQMSLTRGLGVVDHPDFDDEMTIVEVLKEQIKISDALLQLRPNLLIIPSYITLAMQEMALYQNPRQLSLQLEKYISAFDYILIDTPPTLGALMLNALWACTEVIIPWNQSDPYSTQAVPEFLSTVYGVQRSWPAAAKINGVVSTMETPHSKGEIIQTVAKANQMEMETIFGPDIFFKTHISRSPKVAEAAFVGQSVHDYRFSKNTPVGTQYRMLASEIIDQEIPSLKE